eukprot:m.477288 g.477288  ORF g.477288 m.477288 type:complete len:63 (-) comp20800_c0_seq1:21-209(-)
MACCFAALLLLCRSSVVVVVVVLWWFRAQTTFARTKHDLLFCCQGWLFRAHVDVNDFFFQNK